MSIDVETIKAEVRARLNARINEHPEVPGVAFDHGDYIIEELAGDLIGFTRVNAFYDPSIGLPQDPSGLDRYIATATANGWTKNNIYTYIDGNWHETEFEPGLTFAYVIAEDNYYGAYPAGWQELSIGGIDDYVTLTTDQNVTGKKTFSQGIGIGTTDPQSMIHINLPYEDWMGGIQISKGFADESDGVTINLAGADALYGVSYTGRHIFNIETRQGVWETGLVIEDTPVNGPAVTTPQIVVGEPTGSDMGIGSLNAKALYVNGEPVITGNFDIEDYVTIATDQNITGQKSFSQGIGIGTDNPQRLLHLNTDDSSDIGIGIGRYNDIDNYLTIGLDGGNASYNIGYSGSHVFEVETAPGESEIGLWISGHFHSGPTVQAYQLVAGNPYGWGMGAGSINAEALYVEGEPVVTGTFDIDDYVTLTTDQNISGQKNFTKQIGIGTTNPQNMLHIDIPYEEYMGGIQITRGWVQYGDSDDGSDLGLNIRIAGWDALYSVSYAGRHIFNIETTPGVWETGMAITDTPVNGPVINTPQIVVGEPTGSDMGIGSLNAEALYVNGEPVVTGTFDSSDYYTKSNLQTSGQASVHAGNITNVPWLTSLPSHDHDTRYYTYTQLQTSGQSQVHAGNITNVPWLTSLPSHDHDTRYYTYTQLQTSGQSQVHWGNLTNKPSEFPVEYHVHDTDDLFTGVLPVKRGGTGFSNRYGYVVAHGINNPMDTIELIPWNHIDGKPTVFPPADHNHDDRYLTGNPFDQDLNTTDRVKFDGIVNQNAGVSSCHYRSVASKEIRSSSSTGTMKITMPQSWSSTMITIRIRGYNYSSATGWWECIVNGYNYTTEQWYYPKCELRGNPPFTDVRLAHDGTKCCLLLGNTSTTWPYPNIHITDVITGYNNYSGWSSGWSIDLITDESGISNITTPAVDRPWHSGNLDPSDYALVSHNHNASDINSGTLSNDRLSFNPDYFVQGETSRRSVFYRDTNPLDNNFKSGFFYMYTTDPANTTGHNVAGMKAQSPSSDGFSFEMIARPNENKLWFGGLGGSGTRQPWREIHHSGVDYIKYDNNPAEVSHPTTSENLGTSNQTLNPTKGIYYAPGRSDTQEITMGNAQHPGQTVEILHNGLQPLRVYCGPGNPPLMINVPEYSILRLRAVFIPGGYGGWSPVI